MGALFSSLAHADSLPERIDLFVSLFDYDNAVVSYKLDTLQRDFPETLIKPETMLPQTSKYPLNAIQRLYRLAKNCSGKLPYNPLVTEPLSFTRAVCKGTKLKPSWFARSGLIHPGGGTYAARYVKKHPNMYNSLKQYMHIDERSKAPANTLLGRLQSMNSQSLQALLDGSLMFSEHEELWLRKGDKYYVFDSTDWSHNARKAGLTYNLASSSTACFVQRGNICWDIEDHSSLLRISMIVLVIANILLVLGWAIYRWNSKRNEMRSRMLILQILTHELRTPIASLSLTVEGFRREFEHLPETVYDEFRRLCEDSRRLRQLAEASKDYLQSDNKPLSTQWVPSVAEWLEFKVEEEFSVPIALNIDNDIAAKLNVYWLGTCIDNLIRNAVKYGVAPVALDVTTAENSVTIKVMDQGSLSHKDWRQLRKPFVSKSGLGLGLTIVESMVGRMGGTMSLIGPPTTFILEIPCETDIASR
ncbi:sensor histidine kinase VxrA [Vibrio palustris]|uniref:histidine kinase n=1 Tax=Vibrio palustris TaxID=1918946 RepID=A0A1R4B4K5_9VIBR|nr:sensor histidine kinase VxrA [Vibrio palustris]SJL83854.1 Sensor protein PfeS [Vibrio palustris]